MATGTLEQQNNILHRTQLADERFDKLNLSDCQLAVYLSRERVAWSVLDSIHHRIVSLNDISLKKTSAEEWKDALNILEEKDFKMNYGSVKIALETESSLLVPQELFIENELKTYVGFSFSEADKPTKDFIPSIPAYNIHCIPSSLFEPLKNTFDHLRIFHTSTCFINYLLKENKNLEGNKLFACVMSNVMHIASLQNGKLQFHNSYQVKTKEDLAYFLVAVTEELNLNPEQVKVTFSGEVTPNSAEFETIRRFLPNLAFAERPKALKYAHVVELSEPHLHSLIYSIHLCE